MLVAALEDADLDYWVAKAGGKPAECPRPAYSTDWSHGGPIIQRERIAVYPHNDEWFGIGPSAIHGRGRTRRHVLRHRTDASHRRDAVLHHEQVRKRRSAG